MTLSLLFWIFAVLLLLGVALGIWALTTRGARGALDILKERLARGEISSEEYRERAAILGGAGGSRVLGPVAAVLAALGLSGLLVTSLAFGFSHMRDFDRRGMGSMMGGMRGMSGMMSGDPGREGPPPTEGARDIRIASFEFGFEPRELRITAGETVNIILDNRAGHMFHTLTVGRLGFELRANGGQRLSGSLLVREGGRYEFVCTVPGHAEAGMIGVLIVEG